MEKTQGTGVTLYDLHTSTLFVLVAIVVGQQDQTDSPALTFVARAFPMIMIVAYALRMALIRR